MMPGPATVSDVTTKARCMRPPISDIMACTSHRLVAELFEAEKYLKHEPRPVRLQNMTESSVKPGGNGVSYDCLELPRMPVTTAVGIAPTGCTCTFQTIDPTLPDS
jgi:hypothetical protein